MISILTLLLSALVLNAALPSFAAPPPRVTHAPYNDVRKDSDAPPAANPRSSEGLGSHRLIYRRARHGELNPSDSPVHVSRGLAGWATQMKMVTIPTDGAFAEDILDGSGNIEITYIVRYKHGKHRHRKNCPHNRHGRAGTCQCKHRDSGKSGYHKDRKHHLTEQHSPPSQAVKPFEQDDSAPTPIVPPSGSNSTWTAIDTAPAPTEETIAPLVATSE